MLENITYKNYRKIMLSIAIPIMIQSLLSSSLGMIDQIMVGQLGDTVIASIGLANKVPTIAGFTLGAIATGCAILASQYFGKKDNDNVSRTFKLTFLMGIIVSVIFFAICFFLSTPILRLFSKDQEVIVIGAKYLKIVSVGAFGNFMFAIICSLFRSRGRVISITIISIASLLVNTFLNYCLIGGNLGFNRYGSDGAAYATVIAQYVAFLAVLVLFIINQFKGQYPINFKAKIDKAFFLKVFKVTWPIVLCELLWSLGESVYGAIYGNIGTAEAAAMTLIGPIVIFSVSLFSGLSSAASVMVGNRLGVKDNDLGYFIGKKSLIIGGIGTIIIGVVIVIISRYYVNIYEITEGTKQTTIYLLYAFASVLWIKVSNMINGGILKSGGKTYYVLILDIIGTWCIGVPLGFLSAFVFHLPIVWVYLLISFEELVRLIVGLVIFKKRHWIKQI